MGNKNFVLRLFVLVAFVGTLSGCPGGGGGDVTLTNAPSTSNPVGISLTFNTMNGKTASEIAALSPSITDNSGVIYYNTTSLVITGSCSLGVSKVVATVDGSSVAETATCDSNSNFTWSRTMTAGASYTVVLKPADGSGTVFSNLTSDQMITKQVTIDTTAPTGSSGATVNGVSPTSGVYIVTGSGLSTSITVSTSATADLFRVAVSNDTSIAVTYTPGSAPISFTDTVTEGIQKTYNVVVYDRAGNASTAEVIVVSYSSSVQSYPGYRDLKAVRSTFSNNNGSDAVIMVHQAGGFVPTATASYGSADTLYMYTGFLGYSTQNP